MAGGPEYVVAGWGKPMAARVWHYYENHPTENWAALSLCGKWTAEITAGGLTIPRLWSHFPDTGSIYGTCKACNKALRDKPQA